MIYSIKCTENIILKIIFHLFISTNISFYYFEVKKKEKNQNLGAFDSYYSIIFFEIKDRNSII